MLTIRRPTGALLLTLLVMVSPAKATSSGDAAGAQPPRQFSVHDTDGDGYLSRGEYEVFYRGFEQRHRESGRPAHRMLRILKFEQIDSNGDGRISENEMLLALRERRRGSGWRWRQWND